MFGEIVSEMIHEIAASPLTFALEVVQFGVLVGIAYVAMFGIGRRKGMVVNMLSERRRRVAERVERASGADTRFREATENAQQVERDSRAEVARILQEARATARQEGSRVRAAADEESSGLRQHAATVLEEEQAEMRVEMRDRLIGVVAQATRGLLNVSMTPQEQRELIQSLIASQVDGLERSLADRPPAGARR